MESGILTHLHHDLAKWLSTAPPAHLAVVARCLAVQLPSWGVSGVVALERIAQELEHRAAHPAGGAVCHLGVASRS